MTKLGNRTINYAAMPKADYILVTHEHGDHFDKGALGMLTDSHTRLITNQRCADMYGSGEVMANGDTEDIAEMADIKDIDIAFLPCNQPYTMTAEQLVRAARTLKPKVLFPYHYGQTDVSGIQDQLRGDGIDVRIRHYE